VSLVGLSALWDDWPALDRAIEKSVIRIALAWVRSWPGVLVSYSGALLPGMKVMQRPYVTVVCSVEGCGLLADG
jgi:hypothetical protein